MDKSRRMSRKLKGENILQNTTTSSDQRYLFNHVNKQDVMTLIAPLRELRSPINHPHPFPHENGSVLESRNVSKGNTVSILDQAVTRTLTDSAIRATAETVKPNKSSPLRYAGKSCSISEFFLTHATGSKILSQTSINEKKL